MKVVGLDLSLTSTGVASSVTEDTYRIKTNSKTPLEERLHAIADGVEAEFEDDVFVLIEEVPSHGAFSISVLGKVHGAVLDRMVGVNYLYVTPPVLKKYATGKGNANKDMVLAAAIRRFGFEGSSNDEADAWILMHLGLELAGTARISVPISHRSDKLTFPGDDDG